MPRKSTELSQTQVDKLQEMMQSKFDEEAKRKLQRLSEEVKSLLAQKRYTAALLALLEIVSETQRFENDPHYLALQADALNWIGFVYRTMKRNDEAIAYIDEALDILDILYAEDRKFGKQFAKALINEAAWSLENEGMQAAQEAFEDAQRVALELEDEDPCMAVDLYYEGAMLFKEIKYVEKAKTIANKCEERARNVWVKKLERLENRLRRKSRSFE